MWTIRNALTVISRYFGIRRRLESIRRVKCAYYARGAASRTTLYSGGPPKRWIYNSVRCELCARVDNTKLIIGEKDILRECLFPNHDYMPPGALLGEDNEVLVSPNGTTCSHFLSRAW